MTRPIYLDHQSTTPVDPRVLEAMLPYFTERFGNAASRTHAHGWEALEAVERARAQIAGAIGAAPEEIVFTSGATEANNLAIKGAAEKLAGRGRHLVTVVTEHPAALDPCATMESRGFEITRLPVGRDGLLDLDALRDAIRETTILISVMAANNEIGVVPPLAEIGEVARERGTLWHTDATQALGKIPFDTRELGVGLASFSAHKFYGPKGVGALFVSRYEPRARLIGQLDGGGHERGLRSGTLNVPGIVGMGAAAEIAIAERETEAARLRALRDRLWRGLSERLDLLRVNGDLERRLPGNLNVTFEHCDGETLIARLPGVAVSSGSACSSAKKEPSHVLSAIGLTPDQAQASVRFGLGRGTTESEIDSAIEQVVATVESLRRENPMYQLAKQGIVAE